MRKSVQISAQSGFSFVFPHNADFEPIFRMLSTHFARNV